MWYTIPELAKASGESDNLLRYYACEAIKEGLVEMVRTEQQGSRRLYQCRLSLLDYIRDRRHNYYRADREVLEKVSKAISILQVAAQCSMTPQRTGFVLKRLLAQGLVERTDNKYKIKETACNQT